MTASDQIRVVVVMIDKVIAIALYVTPVDSSLLIFPLILRVSPSVIFLKPI